MTDVLSFGLLSFTSLFTIIDPIAAAPMFVAMTDTYEKERRRKTAIKACVVALAILVVFSICGSFIFKMFGITIDALRIAGGVLFFITSLQMLTGLGHTAHGGPEKPGTDPAIVPIGMPMICGPGAISTVMVLMGQQKSLLHVGVFFTALVTVIVLTATVLILAPNIVKVIGKSGVEVVTRIIGMIVGTIGVQFIIDGMRPVVLSILSQSHS